MNQPATTGEVTPQRINQMAWGYTAPLMIEAGVQTGLFAALEHTSKTADQLAGETHCSLRGMRMLANGLIGIGLLGKDAQSRYSLTPESAAFLVPGKPGYQGGLFKHISVQLMPRWMKLTEAVKTGNPAFAVDHQEGGAEFFNQFVEDIFPMSYPSAKVLAGVLKIAESNKLVSVLDLAAGSGVWGIALAQESKNVKVTAVDWEAVLPVTRKITGRFGVGDRFTFVGGDLLDSKTKFGSGHQIATLGHILHSEGEARSRELLKKTASALTPGGTIAIAEFTPNDDRSGPPLSLMFALNMLVNTTAGDTFTLSEVNSWLVDAGFENVRTVEAPGPAPLILATRAGK